MTRNARAPTPPLDPDARLDHALRNLTDAITELIRLSADNPAVPAHDIELLRLRRQQLSSVIDRLAHFKYRQE